MFPFFFTKIFNSFHFIMFSIEFVIMFFVVKFALSSDTKEEAIYIIIMYMFLCFGESLCIMRQHISFAILLYSTRFLKKKKYLLCLLLFIMSYLFHSSSIIFLLIYFLLIIKDKKNLEKYKSFVLFCLIILSLGLLNLNYLLNLLINIFHILPSRYNLYISSAWFYSIEHDSILTPRFILNLLYIFVVLICYYMESSEEQKKKYADY